LVASAAADGHVEVAVDLEGQEPLQDSDTVTSDSGTTTASAAVESSGYSGSQKFKMVVKYKTLGGQACSKKINGGTYQWLDAQGHGGVIQ